MATLEIFGFSCKDLDTIRDRIERATGFQFRPRESQAGRYYLSKSLTGRIVLYANMDDDMDEGDEPLRPEFAAWPTLLNVESDGNNPYRDVLLGPGVGAVFLRQTEC